MTRQKGLRVISILNKVDLLPGLPRNKQFRIEIDGIVVQALGISAEKSWGISELEKELSREVSESLSNGKEVKKSSFIVTNERQKQELMNCAFHLEAFCKREHETLEMRAEHLKEAVKDIGRLTGKVDVEEVLDKLFLDFCIGK